MDEELKKRRKTNQKRHAYIDAPSFVDPKLLVLNHSDTFGCFNRRGDIISIAGKIQGLFHKGCRHISWLELKVFQFNPDFLSSTIGNDNYFLSADLTNPNFTHDDQDYNTGIVHIKRLKFIYSGILHEEISLSNYYKKTLEIPLSLCVKSDFRDLFELRGIHRASKSGNVDIEYPSDKRVDIYYHGIDNIIRSTVLSFSDPFKKLDNNSYEFIFKLASGKTQKLIFSVDLQTHKYKPASLNTKVFSKQLKQEIHNKGKQIAEVISSNAQFNQWINRSRVDLVALLAPVGEYCYPLAGIPWYNTVFGRDGLITAFQTLFIAPHIAKDVLLYLAKNQAHDFDTSSDAEPGKILHEIREGELVNIGEVPFRKYYGTIDATPLFIWLAGTYFERTNDIKTIHTIWPNIKAALEWIDNYGDMDQDGFVEYQKRSLDGLDNQGWKDSHDSIHHQNGHLAKGPIALCEAQAYVYKAKLSAGILAQALNEDDFSEQMFTQAKILKKRFNEIFWDEELQYYVIALDGKKEKCKIISSNPGHCLAAGIVDDDKAGRVVKHLFSNQMYSGWGIRTLGSNEHRFNPMSYHNGSIWPHDNSLIVYGLFRYRFMKEAAQLIKSLFNASPFLELQRMPELFCGFKRSQNVGPTLYPVACSPQAWAVASVFLLIQSMIGIKIYSNKKLIILTRPIMPDFLNEIRFNDIWLEDGKSLSFRVIRYENDVGVEIIDKPNDWDFDIRK